MKKYYRIVPISSDCYEVQSKWGWLGDWVHCHDYTSNPQYYFSSLEEAKKIATKLRKFDEEIEENRKERERFKRDNPPIYL